MKQEGLIPAKLILEDGNEFNCFSFGAETSKGGEVVFNTGMTGYIESISDPSYFGQILVQTYPLIGNYGVPDILTLENKFKHLESNKAQVKGLIVSDYSFKYSNYQAKESLSSWLKRENVPAVTGIDTRKLTLILREKGSMLGKIIINKKNCEYYNPSNENLSSIVSTKKRVTYGKSNIKIALIDCGVKTNIIRCLLKRNIEVIKVPWNDSLENLDYQGILISNGPGDPSKCGKTIENVKKFLKTDIPIFGICLGNQIMALASGGKTYKLKYGHRGYNQPVIKTGTDKCYVTSQNHGYAVETDSLHSDWKPLFENLNDSTNEGIIHKNNIHFAVQFHPEANGGPNDTEFLFDDFILNVKAGIK